MIPVSLCVCLHLGVSSSRAFSLPQSSPLYPERLASSLLRGSRGGYRRKPQNCKSANPSLFSPSVNFADSFAPSPFSARASAIRSCTCGRQRLTYLLTLSTYRCADLTAFSALFRIPISAFRIILSPFSSLSPRFIKKISFQCKFFASVCKKLLQKGQKSFII